MASTATSQAHSHPTTSNQKAAKLSKQKYDPLDMLREIYLDHSSKVITLLPEEADSGRLPEHWLHGHEHLLHLLHARTNIQTFKQTTVTCTLWIYSSLWNARKTYWTHLELNWSDVAPINLLAWLWRDSAAAIRLSAIWFACFRDFISAVSVLVLLFLATKRKR